jgi:hypothetical protein
MCGANPHSHSEIRFTNDWREVVVNRSLIDWMFEHPWITFFIFLVAMDTIRAIFEKK